MKLKQKILIYVLNNLICSNLICNFRYLALTYDHRLVDGREAVTFLKSIKDEIEDPRRLLLDL